MVAKLSVQLAPQSATPPGRANPASPRASELAAMFCAEAGAQMKQLETVQSEADDHPNEPEMALNLDLEVSPHFAITDNLHPLGQRLTYSYCATARRAPSDRGALTAHVC